MVTDWKSFLHDHEVGPEAGFLLFPDPDQSLSSYFEAWDQAARHLPEWIAEGVLARELERLPFKDPGRIGSKGELERAMLILSFLGSALVHSSANGPVVVPRNLAVPWRYIATRLGRPPALSHASAVLANWRRIHPSEAIMLGNIEPLITFTRTPDEPWFYMVTVQIEAQASSAVMALALALEACTSNNQETLVHQLKMIRNALRLMIATLKRMKEGCAPDVFYHRIRPFLASYKEVGYDMGGRIIKESWHGGSAAQSSVLPLLDAAFGIQHLETTSAKYMKDMLKFMPPKHATMITRAEENTQLDEFSQKDRTISSFIAKVVETIHDFRTEHFKIAHEYIVAQAKAEGGYQGTGGTDVSFFLKSMRDDTKKKGD